MNNCARMLISGEVLRELLHLPKDAIITGSRLNSYDGRVEIVVEHPDLPEPSEYTRENDWPPLCEPTFLKHVDGTVAFIAWNVEQAT